MEKNIKNKDLKRRIIEISHKYHLSHIGSCITAVDIIKEIYDKKKTSEKFILSSGHAGLALYVVIESKGGRRAEDIFKHHGVHPDRCLDCGLDCSTGSLGQGLPIAVGMALADRSKNVYCLISDGESAEGSISEAIRIKLEQNLHNLKVYLNFNGWGAYKEIDLPFISGSIPAEVYLVPTHNVVSDIGLHFLEGQQGHYHTMSDDDYKLAVALLE